MWDFCDNSCLVTYVKAYGAVVCDRSLSVRVGEETEPTITETGSRICIALCQKLKKNHHHFVTKSLTKHCLHHSLQTKLHQSLYIYIN